MSSAVPPGLPLRLRRAAFAAAAVAVAGMYFTLWAPPFARWPFAGTSMLAVHLLFELVALLVAMLIVIISWHSFEHDADCHGGVLITGFSIVACCDLLHALTYEGMPHLHGTASTPRAIYFWLAGRGVETATLLALAWPCGLRLPRGRALALGLAGAALLAWIGFERLHWFPQTFVGGQGVTAFKSGFEVAVSVLNLAIAWRLWRRAAATASTPTALIALSAFVIGVGELAFARYLTPSDFQNVFGHAYKVAAYLLLYRAVFVSGLCRPFELVKASEARARESEARMRSLAASLPNCVVYQLVTGPGGERRLSWISDAVEAINGWSAASLLRDARPLFDAVLEEDRPLMAATQAAAERDLSLFDALLRVRRADGALRTMHVVSRPRRIDGGRIVWDGVQIDVTEREQAEQARLQLERQLREAQKMEAVGTLAGGIAHDFNNVLAAVIGNVALARDDLSAGLAAHADRALAQADRAARHGRELVRKILSFSRPHAPQRECRALQPLVDEGLALLRATLPAGVRLEQRMAPQPLYALVDGTELQQVLMNLCTNAWHALGGPGGTVAVGLEAGAPPADAGTGASAAADARAGDGIDPGRWAHLWVRDDGCGMSAQTLQRIFEPFFTTKAESGGTGIGLAMVHGIVRAHGGLVHVDSAPGRGSTFHVWLPLTDERPVAVSAAARALPAAPLATHVLYIDDDETVGLMVERLLAREGHRVTVLREPRDAAAVLGAASPPIGVVVTDFNMPAMSGLDAARALRAVSPGLPVVLTSGYVSDELRRAAQAAGIAQVLEKQNTLEELPAAVQQALRAAQDAGLGAGARAEA